MSVLVVEDDAALRALLETILSRSGIATRAVSRGDEALKAIFEGTYDAIVLDLILPGLSGEDLLRSLREKQPGLLTRVIVITAVSSGALKNFEFGSLVWKVIRKPFDIDEVVTSTLACITCHSGQMPPNQADLSHWFERRSATVSARTGVVTEAIDRGLHLRADFGYAAGTAGSVFPVAMDRNYPICVAFRRGTPVWLASLNLASPEYPLLLSIWTASGSQAIAALPFSRNGTTLGTIGWSFDQPQAFEEPQRYALSQIASECAVILGRDTNANRGEQARS